MKNNYRKSLVALLITTAFGTAHATKLEDSVSKAVLTNPEVLAKWHQLKAELYERDVSQGRYLPTLDVVLGAGNQEKTSPSLPSGTHRYAINNAKLSLRLNVFEGMATVNETTRLEHAAMVRFHELRDLSETAALESTKAFIDLYRYRRLMEMAEENYAVHRLIFDKINERTKSGVGRGVDMEFAAGRLALAESNLLIEASNLHDVTARYQRIVGDMPKGDIDPPGTMLGKSLPKTRSDAIVSGFESSPQLKAAVENILAAQRNVAVQRAGYYPRVDLYAESSHEKNDGGIPGTTRTGTIGVVATMNLYRGQQDISRERKAAEESYAAKDNRERVCRDLRQSLAMSFNDHLRITEQLNFLDQHQLSTDKAREAFRKQFDIGQRTLLDVLDTENEYYTARRDYLNGEMDLTIAQAKYLAAAGKLLLAMNLKPLEVEPPKPETPLDQDAMNNCPPEPAMYPVFDKEAVFARAKAKETLIRGQSMQNAEQPK